MSRVLIVAKSEFLTIVRTKAFIIGILMAPLLIGLSFGFQVFLAGRADVDDHKFAVIDGTGVLFDAIAAAAVAHNERAGDGPKRTGSHYLPERVVASDGVSTAALRVELSTRVRKKELFGFVEIPASVIDLNATKADRVDYYTETPSYSQLPSWLEDTVEREVIARRFTAAAVDSRLVAQLTRRTDVATSGLFEQKADGTVTSAKRVSGLQTFALPFGLMYLLFLSLMSSAPQLLTAVIEEKMTRVSEVLIASISPFQLMAGKLLGVSGISAVLALVYFGGAIYATIASGQPDLIRPALIGWFVLFLVCAVLMFGSLFIAIGASCSDIKDSQSMMQPVMILIMIPIIAATAIIRAPNATFSVVLSLIPTATPFLMLVRLALTPPPPLWQVALGVTLTLSTAALMVWAASKVFRIGLLMQGKPPNLPELLRWIRQ
jgi:ABC-2 type transport system permease protein